MVYKHGFSNIQMWPIFVSLSLSVPRLFMCIMTNQLNMSTELQLIWLLRFWFVLSQTFPWTWTRVFRCFVAHWVFRLKNVISTHLGSTLSLTSALDGGGWLTSRPGFFTPSKETRYPFYRRLGGFQDLFRRVNHPHWHSIHRLPVRGLSLYWQSYRGFVSFIYVEF